MYKYEHSGKKKMKEENICEDGAGNLLWEGQAAWSIYVISSLKFEKKKKNQILLKSKIKKILGVCLLANYFLTYTNSLLVLIFYNIFRNACKRKYLKLITKNKKEDAYKMHIMHFYEFFSYQYCLWQK